MSPILLQMIEARLPSLLQNLEFLVPRNDKFIIYRIYCFTRNDKLKECERRWLCELAAEVYHKGIQKLVYHYDWRSNRFGGCIEK